MISQLPQRVIHEMAQRHHRFHYYLWHRLRNSWPLLTKSERQAVRDINPAWTPSRPALDAARRAARDNDSGEDFLYMHRCMIAFANDILARVNDPAYPRVEGWRHMPPPGDADYPVPEFPDSGLEEVKSADHFKHFISPWERKYTDPDYLKGVTLGQLGSDIEFTIYNDSHMRWTAPSPVGYRPSTALTQEIDAQWDAPIYDYMGDTYSSRVNPIFWKIHGWVDERIEDWKHAHGITGAIEWRGTWVGPTAYHEHFHSVRRGAVEAVAAEDDVPDELRRIDGIISVSAAAGFDGFIRPTPRRPRPEVQTSRRRTQL
ncbi:MAG: Tat pathway signal protein [Acidobacteriota bacterium]|nr:Tat pathway signal protein [Acidobacteriota bacterium]